MVWCVVLKCGRHGSCQKPEELEVKSEEEEAMSEDEVKVCGSRYKAAAIHNTIVINNDSFTYFDNDAPSSSSFL